MTTFVVQLEVTPEEHADSATQATGAYANVYVLADSQAEALDRAKKEVNQAGWNFKSIDRVSIATAGSFEGASKGLEYYEQCQIDGIVLVFHSWRELH